MYNFLKLIRYKNLLIIIFTQVCVYLFLRNDANIGDVLDWRFILLLFSTFIIAAAGYMINDYSDIKIDVINKPESLIVGKYISPRWVFFLHIVFNVCGVVIGTFLNYKLGIINLFTAWLLWRYSVSFKYKLFIGNIVVAFLMALSLIVVYYPFRDIFLQWLLFYASFAFLTGFIREIIKDVEDMEGDAANGCRTIPIVFGLFRTKIILAYIIFVTINLLVFVMCYFIYQKAIIYPVYLGLFVLIPMVRMLVLLKNADTKKVFTVLSRQMKIVMVLGTLSMGLKWVWINWGI